MVKVKGESENEGKIKSVGGKGGGERLGARHRNGRRLMIQGQNFAMLKY